MSSVKRISGNYTISSVGSSDNVSVITNTFTVNGNMVVTGRTTTIQSNNISTYDPTISVNGNLIANSSPFAGNSGIEVIRGNQPTSAVYWNETVQAWQIASNISNYATYSNIATSGSSSGNVASGTATQLGYYATTGTNISATGSNLTWSSNVLTVTGNVVATNYLVNTKLYLKTTSSSVASLSGNIVVAAATANSGGTGLYVNNGTATDELVSKTRARKFGLIL